MPNYRMLPPTAVANQTCVANGRTYTATPGNVLDVPDFDSGVLAANGWSRIALSGPTTARPVPASKGLHYYDTTVPALVIYDGATWRLPTGASA
jgi:hypothetical protein